MVVVAVVVGISYVDNCSSLCTQRLTVNAIAAELASRWLNRCCAAAQHNVQTLAHTHTITCALAYIYVGVVAACARAYVFAHFLVVLVWSLH